MPIYEYKCNNCDNNFEMLVLGGDKPACPSCKSLDLSRLISKCGFVSKSTDSSGQSTVTASPASACSGCAATSCSSCTSS
ncbi:MAG: zinc ribbon domain-containing protein [Desulfobacterium sp.]|jgi:putative FmdB family regulatory protein|nr:zinc ribbon domain-containing protein [Desulfobacterium sp.]